MTEENADLIISTIVDPKFKKLSFLDEDTDPYKYYKFAAQQIDKKFTIIPSVNAEISQKKVTKENFLSDDEDDADSKTKTTLQELKNILAILKCQQVNFLKNMARLFNGYKELLNFI